MSAFGVVPFVLFAGYAVMFVLVALVLVELRMWLRAKRLLLERGQRARAE